MTTEALSRTPLHRLPRPRALAVALAALVVVGGSYGAMTLLPSAAPVAVPPAEPVSGSSGLTAPGAPDAIEGDIRQIDHSIRAWTANLSANSRDFYAATNLGLLYDGRARLTGDVSDYERAKEALERAMAIAPTEIGARVLHAKVLASMHDFAGALAEASAIYRSDPTQIQALATMSDAEVELGDVAAAEANVATLERVAPGPAVTARRSRLAFLRGHPDEALQLAIAAFDADARSGDTGPSLSWYAYLAGTTALSGGRAGLAGSWFDSALTLWPDSYLALAGRGRVAAALGSVDQGIGWYQRAIAVAPQPDALAILGDLYALEGDATQAAQQYATVDVVAHLAALNQQVFNRAIVLFDANHGRDVASALLLAQQELAVRRDIYGYDAVAWALLANGRAADADAAMQHALALGTRDSMLWYHAGMIASAVGDGARARTFLEEAVALPGALDPLSANRAAAALAGLR